jgi:hypothetical protein
MDSKGGPERAKPCCEAGVLRSGGRSVRLRIFDLSAEGCKIEFVERPSVGERIWVKFDGLESMAGIVRWTAGDIGGIAFEQPLDAAGFRQLANRGS